MTNSDQVNPSKEGWPAAIATCVLALAFWFGAYAIHKNTFHDPNDVLEAKTATAAPAQH